MYHPYDRPPRRPEETISIALFMLLKGSYGWCKLRHVRPERELARTPAGL